ncbi:MAG TPA: DUF1731 domain-containing protein [Bacillus sp. (in: firmicutes)]|nr:DUF1731 domain-containing protein [Bacillus sp. (in: firmicutes)]
MLDKEEGTLQSLKKLTKLGLGGTVGSGQQYISWLHVDDLNRIFWNAMHNKQMTGIYNATSPRAVTNKEFMSALRKAMNKPIAPPTPTPLVWLGSYLFMSMEPEHALTGRNCIPKRLMESNFKFEHTELDGTLKLLV